MEKLHIYDYLPILGAGLKKIELCAATGWIGANISMIVGGWTASMTTLAIFMVFDYITGLMVAFIFKKSKKSKTGGVESKAAWKGLCRKCVTLMLVAVAFRIDLEMHSHFLKEGVCIAFSTSEAISILENAKLMGLPIPEILSNALDVLKKGGNKNAE